MLTYTPFALVGGIVLALLIGRIYAPYPGQWAAPVLAICKRLDRARRGEDTLNIRGVIFALILALLAGWMGREATRFAVEAYGLAGEACLILVVLVLFILPLGAALKAATGVANGVAGQSGERLAGALSALGGEAGLTQHTACRYAMKQLCLRLLRNFMAPVFWAAVAGVAGLMIYAVVAALSNPPQPERYSPAILRGVRGLYEAMAVIPSLLLVGLVICASMLLPGLKPSLCVPSVRNDADKQGVWSDGAVIAAFAGTLEVGIAGQRDRKGEVRWIGPGTAKVQHGHLRKAVSLCGLVVFAVIGLIMSFALLLLASA
ncbi:MAG: adenosylcobinamide-phosphate synthase CbiB [Alphaproteobacteria bacterium]